jgi:glycine cleavage system transcriptional repressor
MTTTPNSYLVITALGPNQANIVNHITQSITNCGGHILDTRMTTLGNEFGIILLTEGTWGAIAKIETNLPNLEKKLGLIITMRRTTPKQWRKKTITYLVHAVTIDREGVLNDLTQFFSSQDISIADINSQTYIGNNGTRMSNMTMNVNISVNTHIPTLREKFSIYCDALNLDAGLEPLRE